MKKQNKADIVKRISIIGVCTVGLALIVSCAFMLSRHTSEILERSKTQATNQSLESLTVVEGKITDYVSYVSTTAGSFEQDNSELAVKEHLRNIKNISLSEKGLKTARYFKDKEICWDLERPIGITKDLGLDYVKSVEHDSQKSLYLGTNDDKMPEYNEERDYPVQLYEFYAPVQNNPFIDGISLYFDVGVFHSQVGDSFRHKDALMSTLVKDNGSILIGDDDLPKSTVKEVLNSFGIYDTLTLDEVTRTINNRQSKSLTAKINGTNHVISIQFNNEFAKDLGIVEVYDSAKLAKEANDFINAIVAVMIVFIVIIFTTIGFLTYNHFRMERKISNAEKHDIAFDCLNRYGFAKEADEIIKRNENSYHAVIIVRLRHYKFIAENFGVEEMNSLQNYIKLTCVKTCKIEEIYGHDKNGDFLMLLHASNREDLISRLKIHAFLTSQYKGSHKFDVSLKYGIYEYQSGEQTSVDKMIDYADEANNTVTKATVKNIDMQFNFYDDNLRKIRLINEDMELRQETALKNGEFQVFYQAKYNLQTHKQDGAEALVRWYDPKTGEYNKPALFMALFESNGFIEKLDKYVYTKVCEYISYSLQQGRKVFPVSVNVSRITATQPDFVDYYTRIKKKYGIANGALTVEFTESFAYENYDVLKSIVDRLHNAGFKTSIDDFGCGYSSYRILKELPMDEIKLDKFFIDYSENPDRINSIFESVIALAKKLNMKVTQEGVEKAEDVELLKKLGCDVIQGYIYSHPLSLTDYLHFVENTKDHNL